MLVEPIREVLGPAVAFKGRAITELWQTAVVLDSGAGCVCVQSPVWADARPPTAWAWTRRTRR